MSKSEVKNKPTREQKIFRDMPVWKSLLKMSIPSMIMMLVFGMYTFMDNVLAINLAKDSYNSIGLYDSKGLVRLYMSAAGPVLTFMFAVTMLFGVGVSRRFSINLGAKKEDRAISTLKTTNQFSLALSLIMIPILLFTAKPWMKSQFSENPMMAQLIADEGFKYGWIIIVSMPFQMFNTIISSVFRAEARNKQMMIAMLTPIVFNLLFDWVFMGPAGMGVEGGAWATFISYIMTTMILVFYMATIKGTRINFHNTFGRTGFKMITLVGVVLVGVAPFMRNMAQSFTQTIEMRQLQDVSQSVYGNNMQMSVIMTAVFPVFGLFFPMMFGFIQAGSPIAGYNYGAGNMKRVKQTTWFIILYSFITAILIFVISAFLLINPLNEILGIEDQNYQIMELRPFAGTAPTGTDLAAQGQTAGLVHQFPDYQNNFTDVLMTNKDGSPVIHMIGNNKFTIINHIHKQNFHTLDKAQKMYAIMMSGAFFFGPALGAMSLFGSTDRPLLNLFGSSLRGLILLIPFLFLFAGITKGMDHDIVSNNLGTNGAFTKEFFFWWFYPVLAAVSSIILLITTLIVLKNLDKKHTSLDDKIEKIYNWNQERIKKKKEVKASK